MKKTFRLIILLAILNIFTSLQCFADPICIDRFGTVDPIVFMGSFESFDVYTTQPSVDFLFNVCNYSATGNWMLELIIVPIDESERQRYVNSLKNIDVFYFNTPSGSRKFWGHLVNAGYVNNGKNVLQIKSPELFLNNFGELLGEYSFKNISTIDLNANKKMFGITNVVSVYLTQQLQNRSGLIN